MKKVAVEFEIDGKTCRMGGIAKGSGMIHPNMATMLVFLTTDAAISAAMLQKALSHDVQKTFNMLSVDGDTSPPTTWWRSWLTGWRAMGKLRKKDPPLIPL